MERYFFHLDECGVVLEDHEGQQLSDLEAARKFGRAAARDVIPADVQEGQLRLDAYILIKEDGAEVARVYFKEALSITGLDPVMKVVAEGRAEKETSHLKKPHLHEPSSLDHREP